MLLRYFLVFFYILPRLHPYLCIVSITLFVLGTGSFFIASYTTPGYMTTDGRSLLVTFTQELFEKYTPESICPICQKKQPEGTRHCFHCRRCVKGYDHHCPWINNCVGSQNLVYFRLFIFTCLIDLLYHMTIGLVDYFVGLRDTHPIVPDLLHKLKIIGLLVSALCGLSALVVLPVCYYQCKKMVKRRVDRTSTELSETASMLLHEDSEWNPLSFNASEFNIKA